MTKQVFLEDQTTRPNQTQVVKLYDLQFQKIQFSKPRFSQDLLTSS